MSAKKGDKVSKIPLDFKGVITAPKEPIPTQKGQLEEDKSSTKKCSSSNPERKSSADQNRSYEEEESDEDNKEDSYYSNEDNIEEDTETPKKSIKTKTYNTRACCIII